MVSPPEPLTCRRYGNTLPPGSNTRRWPNAIPWSPQLPAAQIWPRDRTLAKEKGAPTRPWDLCIRAPSTPVSRAGSSRVFVLPLYTPTPHQGQPGDAPAYTAVGAPQHCPTLAGTRPEAHTRCPEPYANASEPCYTSQADIRIHPHQDTNSCSSQWTKAQPPWKPPPSGTRRPLPDWTPSPRTRTNYWIASWPSNAAWQPSMRPPRSSSKRSSEMQMPAATSGSA